MRLAFSRMILVAWSSSPVPGRQIFQVSWASGKFAFLREGVQATSLVQLMRTQMEDIDSQLVSAASKA